MDLESIQNKKIRNQLRYLQLELEETKIIYQGCIEKFNNDLRDLMSAAEESIEEFLKIENPEAK